MSFQLKCLGCFGTINTILIEGQKRYFFEFVRNNIIDFLHKVISFGYPDEDGKVKDKRNEERIHYEK